MNMTPAVQQATQRAAKRAETITTMEADLARLDAEARSRAAATADEQAASDAALADLRARLEAAREAEADLLARAMRKAAEQEAEERRAAEQAREAEARAADEKRRAAVRAELAGVVSQLDGWHEAIAPTVERIADLVIELERLNAEAMATISIYQGIHARAAELAQSVGERPPFGGHIHPWDVRRAAHQAIHKRIAEEPPPGFTGQLTAPAWCGIERST